MADYIIGDIQGCYSGLMAALAEIDFQPGKDTLWLTGDIVARGEDSLSTVKFLYNRQDAVKLVLGNHDLHLLAVANGLKKTNPKDNLGPLLHSKKLPKYLDWLRQQPLLCSLPGENAFMSHAGLAPHWTPKQACKWADAVSERLRADDYVDFLPLMYGNRPNAWSKELTKEQKLTFAVSALTRMRYCDETGALDFEQKGPPEQLSSRDGLLPWFKYRPERLAGIKWVFGHWASLLGKTDKRNIIGLDTGYIWGGYLSVLDWQTGEIIKIYNN